MAVKRNTLKKIETSEPSKDELLAQVREAEKKLKEASAKLNLKKEQAYVGIKKIEDDNGLFCGVLLGKDDLVNIFKLALETGEAVKIPFQVYDL